MKRKRSKYTQFIDIKCPKCGKVTRHSLTPLGDYRCIFCGNATKHVGTVYKVGVTTDITTDYLGNV